MSEFPPVPVPPAELIEGYLPAAFAEFGAPEGLDSLDASFGVQLVGEGGGEWVLELHDGELRVRAGSRAATAFSYVQSVDDWRGALWEGRGGALGRGAAALFRPDAPEARAASGLGGSVVPAALEALGEVEGLLSLVVTEGDGEWRADLKLGPGEIPREPTTEVRVSGEDGDALAAGELAPVEAFMAGRIAVVGDVALLLQLQAAGMQAAGRLAGGGRG